MPRERLRQKLDELHAELEQTKELDDEDRQHLAAVMGEIREAVDQSGPASRGSFTDRLKESLTRFEASHPRLAALVREISTTLSEAGI